MSRSKESKDIEREDRKITRTKRRDDYTWGRESRREYPRRSTSSVEQTGYESPSQLTRGNYARRYDEEIRREQADRYSDSDTYRNRSYSRSGRDYRQPDETYRSTEDRRYPEHRYPEQIDRGSYRQRERIEYDDYDREDIYPQRSEYPDPRRVNTSTRRTPDYSRTESDYRADLNYYDDSYNRYVSRPSSEGYERVEDQYEWVTGYGRTYLRCGDIMTKDVTFCYPQTPLREVAEKMEDEDVGSIPVVDNDRLIGIVTDRDIVCRILAEGIDSQTATAADAMSRDIVTVTTDESVVDAMHKMGDSQIRRLPVVGPDYRLRGIVSMADIAIEAERDRELARSLEQISQPARFQTRRF